MVGEEREKEVEEGVSLSDLSAVGVVCQKNMMKQSRAEALAIFYRVQQSTNDGGKQMRMTIWGGTSRSKAVKPTEAKVSVVKRPAAQQQQEL